MSSSYSVECELRALAEELHAQAYDLEKAAEVLETLRTSSDLKERVDSAKRWAEGWMKR